MTTNDRANGPNPAHAHEEMKTDVKMDMKSKLSTLWIFAALNYLSLLQRYRDCDHRTHRLACVELA
jgi:hypothetical protein